MESCRVPHLKSLALTLSIAAIAPVAISQEVPQQEKVYLEADILIDDKENEQMIAEGSVVARYEGRELYADKVIYNLKTKKVRAIGNVRIIDADGTIRHSEEVEVDDKLGDGVATQFTAQLPQDAVVVARAANRLANGSNSLDRVVYTACVVCQENNYTPTWSLRARKAVQNAETKMITYQDAVFEIKGVPVFYLPYFAHPDPSTDRRSGLLPPTPKISSKLGFVYQQPYYWAISKSQDLTITPNLHTKVNPTLSLDYRKRFYSGRIQAYANFAYDYLFDSNGDPQFLDSNGNIVKDPSSFNGPLFESERSMRSSLFADGVFDINQDWNWGFAAQRVSDDTFLRRYDIDKKYDTSGIYEIAGPRLLSQIYAVRQNKNSYFDIASLSIQSLVEGEGDETFGVVTPIAFGEQVFDYGSKGLVSLQGSAMVLNRNIGDDTRRLTASAQWENFFVAPAGLVFEPMAKLRADYYDYSFDATATTAQIDDTDTRTTALAAATLRMPFVNRSKHFDMVIEPIAMVAYSDVSVDNGLLPNEDSTNYEYTLADAFEPDPFGNGDLIESGARVAAGFRGYTDFRNGVKLKGAFARRWRDKTDPALEIGTNLDGTQSDYLIGAGAEIGSFLSFDSNFRVDDNFELQRVEARAKLNIDRLYVGATYFDLTDEVVFADADPDGQEGIQINSKLRVTDYIDFEYKHIRNIETGENASMAFGVRFHDECSFILFTIEEREIDDRNVTGGTTFRVSFGFKTLGQVSDGTFD